MAGVRDRLSESGDAFRRVFGNRDLRRLQLAFVGSVLGQWSYVVALAVYAYDEGGAGLVGITTLIRLLPGALAAPFVGALADRYSRRGVLIAGDVARASLLGVAALGAATDTLALVLVAVACASVAATAFEPGRAAMLPGLARTPEELTAANVTGSAIDGTGMFLGPALGGLLLVATSPAAVFGATVATLLWSATLVVGVREPERAPAEPAEAPARMLRAVSQGVAAIRADRRVRTLVGLAAAQTLVAGALAVFTVVIAFRLLERGTAWVGYLEAAIGVGGLIGVVVAAGLVGRPRLTPAIMAGIVLFGAPLAIAGVLDMAAVALVAMAAIGVGNTLFDVALYTLLQRAVPEALLARVFGILETVILSCIALGGALAPLVIDALGVRGALLAWGLVLPLLAAATWPAVRATDAAAARPGPALDLLRALPMLAPLPAPTLERLALEARPVQRAAGETVFAQGDPGDAFYVVAEGTVDVAVDGKPVRELGSGEGFGEIALLRDTPRTATVTARDGVELWRLERDDFLAAVTGHAAAAEAAEHVVVTRLGSARPALGTL